MISALGTKWIFPAVCVYLLILVAGSRSYEFRPGLDINAPIITPSNPELR